MNQSGQFLPSGFAAIMFLVKRHQIYEFCCIIFFSSIYRIWKMNFFFFMWIYLWVWTNWGVLRDKLIFCEFESAESVRGRKECGWFQLKRWNSFICIPFPPFAQGMCTFCWEYHQPAPDAGSLFKDLTDVLLSLTHIICFGTRLNMADRGTNA